MVTKKILPRTKHTVKFEDVAFVNQAVFDGEVTFLEGFELEYGFDPSSIPAGHYCITRSSWENNITLACFKADDLTEAEQEQLEATKQQLMAEAEAKDKEARHQKYLKLKEEFESNEG